MKKWLLIALAAIIVIGLVCTLIGVLQPRDHTARSRAVFRAGPQVLWAAISDFRSWPEWNSAFDTMTAGTPIDGKAVWIGKGPWGEFPLVLDLQEPPHRQVTHIAPDADLGFTGRWTYRIDPTPDGGSTLTLTEEGTVPNPIFRFMMLVMGTHRSQFSLLEDLGKHLGETVTPEALDPAETATDATGEPGAS